MRYLDFQDIIVDQSKLDFSIHKLYSSYYGPNYGFEIIKKPTDMHDDRTFIELILKYANFTDEFKILNDISDDELKLLKRINITTSHEGFICPDQKRPFGNTNYIKDIEYILNIKPSDSDLILDKIFKAFSNILNKNSFMMKNMVFSFDFNKYQYLPNVKKSREYKLKKLLS